MATDFGNKLAILADLWMNFRDEGEFKDFIEYNDLGLPLAYIVHTELAQISDTGILYIDETFNLLCAALGLDLDKDYESLQQMFELGQGK